MFVVQLVQSNISRQKRIGYLSRKIDCTTFQKREVYGIVVAQICCLTHFVVGTYFDKKALAARNRLAAQIAIRC